MNYFSAPGIDDELNHFPIESFECSISINLINTSVIANTICRYFNIPRDILESKTRKREIVQCRQIAMYFSKRLTKDSLSTIGSIIGDKDHATVLHACKTINNLIDTDKKFDAQINLLEKRLKM